MTRKTRTILFSFFAFFFVIITPLIVFYSQGYRFDFEAKKVVRTGAFYFKVSPTSAQVYIDGKSKKTDFFFGSVFWQNLLPKKYKVRIEKEGYQAWEKNLEVKEKLVTEAKNIILFPQEISTQASISNIQTFWVLPDQKRIILKKSNASTAAQIDNWRLVIYDTQKNTQSLFLEEIALGKKEEAQIISLLPSPDSKKLLLTVSVGEKLQNFIAEINGQPAKTLTSLNFLGENIEDISFNPANSSKLFFIAENASTSTAKKGPAQTLALYEVDLTKKEISKPILSNLVNYTISGENIYFLQSETPTKKGETPSAFVYKTDFSGKTIEKINETPLPLKSESFLKIIVFASNIFLQENSTLYLLNPARSKSPEATVQPSAGVSKEVNQETKTFETISEKVEDLKISSDSQKISYFSDNELWVLYLKDTQEQPQRKIGEKTLLAQLPEKIQEVFWLNSDYLILSAGNKIEIIETDDRDKVQIWQLGEFSNPKMFFNETDKKLYILSDKKLLVSENLLK